MPHGIQANAHFPSSVMSLERAFQSGTTVVMELLNGSQYHVKFSSFVRPLGEQTRCIFVGSLDLDPALAKVAGYPNGFSGVGNEDSSGGVAAEVAPL